MLRGSGIDETPLQIKLDILVSILDGRRTVVLVE